MSGPAAKRRTSCAHSTFHAIGAVFTGSGMDARRHDCRRDADIVSYLQPLHELERALGEGTMSTMTSARAILEGLTAIANDSFSFAVAWHLILAGALVALAAGWRPTQRLSGVLLALPIASVSAVAWIYGNPFNGSVLAACAATLVLLALTNASTKPVAPARGWARRIGALMIALGWVYPHFLVARSPWAYFYGAPVGLIPCPTLAMTIGLALIGGAPRLRSWSLMLGGVGMFYALFGAFRLEIGRASCRERV